MDKSVMPPIVGFPPKFVKLHQTSGRQTEYTKSGDI